MRRRLVDGVLHHARRADSSASDRSGLLGVTQTPVAGTPTPGGGAPSLGGVGAERRRRLHDRDEQARRFDNSVASRNSLPRLCEEEACSAAGWRVIGRHRGRAGCGGRGASGGRQREGQARGARRRTDSRSCAASALRRESWRAPGERSRLAKASGAEAARGAKSDDIDLTGDGTSTSPGSPSTRLRTT